MATKGARARTDDVVLVNRAPVLTLWGGVVAERLGFDRDEALTLGRAIAGLNAQSKGRSLGIFKPGEKGAARKKRRTTKEGEALRIELLRRAVPAVRTREGVRAVAKDRPIDPASVERYLESKFGDALARVRRAMTDLASSLDDEALAARAYDLYERFRPRIPAGTRGWGAKGELRLDTIRRAAREE